MNLSIVQLLCLYMHVYLFVSISCSDFMPVFSFFINIYIYTHLHLFKDLSIHLYFIYAYNCNYFLYLSRTFLAHVLRPNSFHRCSSFTSHCRSFASLPQKRLRRHARDFHFPACFQVQLTYFHIHVTFSFRSPPWAASTQGRPCWNRRFGFPGYSPKLWFLHFLAQNCTILDRNSWRGLVQRVPITLLNSFMRPFIHCIFPSLQASSPFLQATNNSNRLSPSCSPFLFSNHQYAHSFFRCWWKEVGTQSSELRLKCNAATIHQKSNTSHNSTLQNNTSHNSTSHNYTSKMHGTCVWGGCRSAKHCVLSCRLARASDEGLFWHVIGSSIGVLQRAVADRIGLAARLLHGTCAGENAHWNGSATLAWDLCWGGCRSAKHGGFFASRE